MTTEKVTSETILREIRARVLTLVKNPCASTEGMAAWELELRTLGQLELIYSRPEIIPVAEAQQMQVRP